MSDSKDDAWFLPKRFGYGSGLPIAWQGWALLLGYGALVIGMSALLLPHLRLLFVALTGAATLALCVIAARHTRGGWHWRWRSGGEG